MFLRKYRDVREKLSLWHTDKGIANLSLDVGGQLADTFFTPLLIIEQRATALMVGSDWAACGQYGAIAAEVARAYSILVSLGSAMTNNPRFGVETCGASRSSRRRAWGKVLLISFVDSLRSDQAGACMKGRRTVVVQVSFSAFVKASLGAARNPTLSARLRSRATILSASHDNEWHKVSTSPDRCRWWRDLFATPHYSPGAQH